MLKNEHYANGQKTYELVGNKLTYFFKNGKIKAEGIFANDQMEGEWKFYRESGQLWQIGNFLHNKKNGPWIRYDKNDEVEYMENFENDKLVKKRE